MKRTKREAREIILRHLHEIFCSPYTEEEIKRISKHLREEDDVFATALARLNCAAHRIWGSVRAMDRAVELFRVAGRNRVELATIIAENKEPIVYVDLIERIKEAIIDHEAYKLGITPINWVDVETYVTKALNALTKKDGEVTEQNIADIISSVTSTLQRATAEEGTEDNPPKV